MSYPESTQGLPRLSPGDPAAFRAVPLSDLRSLHFPFDGDQYDVFSLRTVAGLPVVNQFTGEVLETVSATISDRVYTRN